MRHGLIVGTNDKSRLVYASMEAVVRTSLGDEVSIFFTMDGVKAITRNPETVTKNDSSKYLESSNEFYENLSKTKKTGRAKVYACSYASKLYGFSKESYSDLVDAIVGITTFIGEVDGQIVSIW
ncbi:hypothetical protein HS7_02080 [Sulfolobales archaeon HS-7]|nr:hypothetical protein HS7_02080 [Sulfolobales archaeon HS-7]